MPIFYFHVRQRDTRFEDHEGIELADVKAAWEHAHRDARAIVKAGLLEGGPDQHWMEVGDDTGKVIATLPFERALPTH